jgi:hypothetical protein
LLQIFQPHFFVALFAAVKKMLQNLIAVQGTFWYYFGCFNCFLGVKRHYLAISGKLDSAEKQRKHQHRGAARGS